jgi:hypothetical protein
VTSRRSLPPGARGLRLSSGPTFSAVIASSGSRAALEAALSEIVPAAGAESVEVVVARRCPTAEFRDLVATWPNVLWMPSPDGASTSMLRVAGFTAADGDIVVLSHDEARAAARLLHLNARMAAPRASRPVVLTSADAPLPVLTVVVHAHQAMGLLRQSLAALAASYLPREQWELVVVDDASTDETSMVAAEYADVVVRLAGKRHGPAFSRNRGFEVGQAPVTLFVDPDIAVHPTALSRVVDGFVADIEFAAIFGSYDDRPAAPGLATQYRTLLHYYLHQRRSGTAHTFWAGIGAVRSDVFAAHGMFDEWSYRGALIEDVDLGRRLTRAGRQIVSDPALLGTHLGHWGLAESVRAEVQQRGVALAWLTLRQRGERRRGIGWLDIAPLFDIAGLALLVAGLTTGGAQALLWLAAAVLVLTVAKHAPFFQLLFRKRGVLFLARALPLHLLQEVLHVVSRVAGWFAHQLFGEPAPPADVSAHAQLGVSTWPPAPRRPGTEAPAPQDRPSGPR